MRFGYARVSTHQQQNSREAQERQLLTAGCDQVFTDEASGKTTEGRDALRHLLMKLRDGDEVCATRLDRLGRNTRDVLEIAEQVKAAGATLKIGDLGLDTAAPSGELMLTVLAAVATMERRVMLERQAIGIDAAKRQGKYKGRKPTVQAQRETICRMAAEGVKKREIAERLGCSIRSVFGVLAERHSG